MSSDTLATHEVARIVASDTVVAAKVLQMVNSGWFCPGRHTTNIEQAVAHLGFAALRSLVTSAEVFAEWPHNPSASIPDFEHLQQHTQEVTHVACALTADTSLADDALLAAHLHDIGYWILAHECPRELDRAFQWALQKGVPMHKAERETIGSSHAEIGGYLLGIWGLPEAIVTAVAHHHAPEKMLPHGFNALAALAVAHALADRDDSASFHALLEPDVPVGPEYLESVSAPFSWSEAMRRSAVTR